MALDIDAYNATFKAFADFATKSAEAGKTRAVARVGGELASRTITAAKGDWVGVGVGRLYSLKDANNVARDLFRKAIIDMFGGDKTGKMLALYSSIADGDYNDGLDREAAIRLEDRAGSHMTHIAVFKDSIDRALGAPVGTGLLPFGDAFNADEISGPDILDDLMN